MTWASAAVIIGAMAPWAPARAEEESIPVAKLPAAVRKAARAKFPEGKIVGAAREETNGHVVYEVMMKGAGHSIDMSIDPHGKITEIEVEVAAAHLPKAVQSALARHYPHAKVQKVETIAKGEGKHFNYEIVLQTEVVLTPDGKLVEAEETGEKPAASTRKKHEKEEAEEDEEEEEEKSNGHAGREHAKGHAAHGKAAMTSKKKHEKEDDDDDEEEDEKEMKSSRHAEREHGRGHAAHGKAAVTSKKKHEKDEEDDDEEEDEKEMKSSRHAEREHGKGHAAHGKAAVTSKKKHEKDEEDDDDDDDDGRD
jgi:hypothetical protein